MDVHLGRKQAEMWRFVVLFLAGRLVGSGRLYTLVSHGRRGANKGHYLFSFYFIWRGGKRDFGNDETNSKHAFFLLYDMDWELHKCIFVFVSWVSVLESEREAEDEDKGGRERGVEREIWRRF